MRFRLLGELEVATGGGHVVALPAPKQRALLAILLIERGRPVPIDRLVAELWPAEPPATATKTVQVYVAQLRKALGEGVVVTRGRAYAVDLEQNELDVDRFEALSREGRRLLAAGDAEHALAALGEALALWRGAPLADFTYEEFAQSEIARLGEEQLITLEARIDAELALDRGEGLVSELRALVDHHPHRERLRAQLMIALYRSGRQAEALEEYQEARRTLLDELGLEPSPQLQELQRGILEHDESLGPAASFGTLGTRRGRRGGTLMLAGGALLAAAAAAAVLVAVASRDGSGVSSVVEGSSVAAVDPGSGRVVGVYPVGASPAAISVADGYVWALSVDDRTLSRIDPRTDRVRTIGVGAIPTDLVAGAGGVWVGIGGRLRNTTFAGWVATSVARVDSRTGAVDTTVDLPRRGNFISNVARDHLVVTGDEVWAIAPDGSVVRIDPRAKRIVATIRRTSTPVALGAGDGGVWALTDSGAIRRMRTGAPSADIAIASSGLTSLAVGAGAVWATAPRDGTLWRIDPGPRPLQRTIDVGEGADSVTFGGGFVWVTNSLAGTLARVDPRSNRVDRTIPIGNTPTAVSFGEGAVWVAVAGATNAAPATTTRSGDVVALPEAFCGRLYAGAEAPRFLVASDLPLQGGPRFPTVQMSEAILYVLRRHRFRAGPFPLAYQSCDDSTAQTGLFDRTKCGSNAREYVRNESVIGVIGPFNSGCAYPQLPAANRAGLAIVSPSNSDVGLTRVPFQGRRRDLEALHPTGTRTYAHLLSQDDVEAAAAAFQLRRLGARRVYVVYERSFAAPYAFYFKRAAKRLGQEVVGNTTWDPAQPAGRMLARRVASARPDAVYLCGLLDGEVATILSTLRETISSQTIVMGCSGLLPSRFLFLQAGDAAARGTYVAIPGLVNERLGPVGRSFVHDFAATQAGRRVDIAAVYAAQATEVLLAAIARSDGTRASVARELFRTRIGNGLLGDLSIDPNGDPVPAPVTIVRLERRGASDVVMSYDGARVHAVITPQG